MDVPSIRVDLEAPLDGRYLRVNPEELTFGFMEDLQSGQFKLMLDCLAAAIVGGDLPKGTDRAGLRRLKPSEMSSVVKAVTSALEAPKS